MQCCFTIFFFWEKACFIETSLEAEKNVVSGVDRLPYRDYARLIGAGLSDTTAYRAAVYRLSVGPIRDKKADFPPILQNDYSYFYSVLALVTPAKMPY